MYRDLTKGKISSTLILFALPMIGGNLLQQFYNIADTLIVGRVIGRNALAAVGSAYTLMTFLTSVFLGLSMGSGALFSIYYGQNRKDRAPPCHTSLARAYHGCDTVGQHSGICIFRPDTHIYACSGQGKTEYENIS